MNGKRRKALRRAFREQVGRDPNGMEVVSHSIITGITEYKRSEWRRLKKGYKELRSGR